MFTLRNANTFNLYSLSFVAGVGSTDIMNMNTNGISLNKNMTVSGFLKVNGIANINYGNPNATGNNFMRSGSLTIGRVNANYGGGSSWSSNTAGLLLECSDNTEIAVHDASNRVASLIYFQGGGTNKITIGRNMGRDAISSVDICGALNMINGSIVACAERWLRSSDSSRERIYFGYNETIYYQGYNSNGTYNHYGEKVLEQQLWD